MQVTVGSVQLELATFCKALQAFQQAHSIAQRVQDPALELQVGQHSTRNWYTLTYYYLWFRVFQLFTECLLYVDLTYALIHFIFLLEIGYFLKV